MTEEQAKYLSQSQSPAPEAGETSTPGDGTEAPGGASTSGVPSPRDALVKLAEAFRHFTPQKMTFLARAVATDTVNRRRDAEAMVMAHQYFGRNDKVAAMARWIEFYEQVNALTVAFQGVVQSGGAAEVVKAIGAAIDGLNVEPVRTSAETFDNAGKVSLAVRQDAQCPADRRCALCELITPCYFGMGGVVFYEAHANRNANACPASNSPA